MKNNQKISEMFNKIKKCFLFFLFYWRLYLLIDGHCYVVCCVVVVEAEVFFHVVPAWAWNIRRCRGGRGFPSRICECVVKDLRRTIKFVATAAANAILVSFCWCRCKWRRCKCVGWNWCWRCAGAVGFKTCFRAYRSFLLFLCVRKNNPIRRIRKHNARFALRLNPFAKMLWNDAGNPEENVHNCKTEVCIRVLVFHKINARNNCNVLALENALHIGLTRLIAVNSGNVDGSERVRIGWQLWLSGHWNCLVVSDADDWADKCKTSKKVINLYFFQWKI